MSKMMREQFLTFFKKKQKELQRNSFGIFEEKFFVQGNGAFFRKNKTEKSKKKKRRNNKEGTLKVFHRKR